MTVDFDALRARLGASFERLDDAANVERVLRARARSAAARALEVVEREVVAGVVVVRRARSTWGIPMASLEEVREVLVTRLPHASPTVVGLFHRRGQIASLVDLQPLVGPSDALGHGDRVLVAVVRSGSHVLGLRIDEVVGPRDVYADEVDTASVERRLAIVARVTRDCVEILDVPAIFEARALRLEAPHVR